MEFYITPQQSINEALKKLKKKDCLILEDGIYKEKVEIWQSDITIKAKNPKKAIIVNKDYYHKIMANHNECNTFNTFTVYVGGSYVTLHDLIIKNEATPSFIYGQAVALHVDGDRFTCTNCTIEGGQDTLFTGPMPSDLQKRYEGFYSKERLSFTSSIQHYKNCQIIGDVDFIFGTAIAFFEECEIISLNRGEGIGFIAAPAHTKEQPFGYLFYKCNLIGDGKTFLARPWRDYGCASFILCKMGKHILPEGYNKWNNTTRDKTARFYEYTLNTKMDNRESWVHLLNEKKAQQYVNDFLNFIQ